MAVNKSKADLISQAATTLADNTTQAISPQDVREMAENLAESNFNKTTDNALVGLKAYDTGVIYKVSQGVNYNGSLYFANKDTTPGAFNTADWDLFAEQSNVVISGKKASAGTIAKGKPVYLVGFDSDLHTVEEANASAAGTTPVIGFTAEPFNATDGKTIITFGKLEGIDTSAFSVGNDLYLATSAGGLTATRPTGGSSIVQRIAKVLKSSATGGQILIYNTARAAGLPNIAQNNVWIGDANGQPQAVNKSTLAPSDSAIETAYNNQVPAVTQSEAEAGTVTTVKRWTPERVKQAIAALSSGGDSIYTANGTLSGARTVNLDANLLTFDTDSGGQLKLNRSNYNSTDIFKVIGYTAGGNLPFFKIGSYGQIELMGRFNASAFKIYKSGSTTDVCFDTGGTNGGGFIGKGIVTIGESTSSYAYRNQSTSSYSFNRWYRGGNIEHCFNFDSSNPVSFTGFYINGVGNDYFAVGGGAKISTEKISPQGHTLVKGSDTLSTSSALQIYDGDSTPAVLWDFRNNGDLIGANGARIKDVVINPSVNEAASSATFTINSDQQSDGVLTAMAAATTIAAPTGTPVQSQSLVFRFKDDGTARGITWNAIFRAIGVTLPTTTTASKLLYVGCKYNSTDTKWDVVSVQEEA